MASSSDSVQFVHPANFGLVDGIILLPGVDENYLRNIKELPVRKDDIFVVTYPKSGTTWVSEIAFQVIYDGKTDERPIADRVSFLDKLIANNQIKSGDELSSFYSSQPSPRFFKSHLPHHQLPNRSGEIKPKFIYVVRNPKDNAVSLYHHYKDIAPFEFNCSWDQFFEMFIENKVIYGSWFDHVLGWWAHRHDNNLLFLKYENMKKDLPAAVNQIAKFLGKDLSSEMIQRIAHQTTFAAMSDGKGRFYDGDKQYKLKDPSKKFMRKGQVGDWKNYFTDEQNRRFDELYEKRMDGNGLELQF